MSTAIVKYDRWAVIPHVPHHADFDVRRWDGVSHVLIAPWRFSFNGDCGSFSLVLHPGFQTDGGSTPIAAWSIPGLQPWGCGIVAFLVHDGLYATELLPRDQADWLMLEILAACEVSWIVRNAAWRAVRAFGDSVWTNHRPADVALSRTLVTLSIDRPIVIPRDAEAALMDSRPCRFLTA